MEICVRMSMYESALTTLKAEYASLETRRGKDAALHISDGMDEAGIKKRLSRAELQPGTVEVHVSVMTGGGRHDTEWQLRRSTCMVSAC